MNHENHASYSLMKVFLHLVVVFVCSGFAFSQAQKPDRVEVYKKVGGVELKMHIFTPKGHEAGAKRPAIVFFFGGGWNGGTPKQFYPQSRHLADRGMVAMCAEYRVRKTHKTTPKECVMDGKSAVRWARANAGRLGIDGDRLAAGGGSAGGHVAAATALAKGFEEAGEDVKVSCVPDALVLFNPVYDNGPKGWGHAGVKKYWKDFSPMHNIRKGAPPTIVFLGEKDKLIPVATAKEYQKRMKDVGARCDLHLYPGQPHGFFNKAKYEETVAEMDRFLVSLGYLKVEKKENALAKSKPNILVIFTGRSGVCGFGLLWESEKQNAADGSTGEGGDEVHQLLCADGVRALAFGIADGALSVSQWRLGDAGK